MEIAGLAIIKPEDYEKFVTGTLKMRDPFYRIYAEAMQQYFRDRGLSAAVCR